MTSPHPSPSHLYSILAPSWSRAGASPADCIEVILEMLAVAKRDRQRPKSSPELDAGELTMRSWELLRAKLDDAFDLPRGDSDLHRWLDHAPGLLEETRRALSPIFPLLATHQSERFAQSFLEFLAYAPQTGMRQTTLGYFRWPDYLAPLLGKLLGKPDEEPVYCPFDSSGWMPLFLAQAGWRMRCEVANSQTARILTLFAFIGGWELETHVGDAVRRPTWLDGDRLLQFAHSAAITNFGLRIKDDAPLDPYGRFPMRFHYGEAVQVAHLISQTRGRVVVIVPEAFLFRSSGGERDYKEQLVRRGTLSAVIRLPRDAFAAYANVQSSIVILENRQHVRDVLFVDASEDLRRTARSRDESGGLPHAIAQISSIVEKRRRTPSSATASYDEIAAQDFNIAVDRYVRSEEEEHIESLLEETRTLDLIDIAEIIRPQAVSGEESRSAHAFAEVGLQDILPDGAIKQPAKLVHVDDKNLVKAMRQCVEPGDILLSVRGRIGAVAIAPEVQATSDGRKGWLASQAFVILRLRDSSPITRLTLYRYLSSPLGQGLLQSLATGMTVPMVSMGDVKKLRIMIPSPAEQRELERQYEKVRKLHAQIQELEKLAAELNSAGWPMTKVSTQDTH